MRNQTVPAYKLRRQQCQRSIVHIDLSGTARHLTASDTRLPSIDECLKELEAALYQTFAPISRSSVA